MQSREQTTDHGVTEQTVGMQSRLQRMRDNADIKDTADTVDVADTVETVDTVETRDPEQMDRELGWITNHQLY